MIKKHCSENKIGEFFDVLFWYAIYLLPVILMVVSWINNNPCTLTDVFATSGLGLVSTNPVVLALVGCFGSSGQFPIFADDSILVYFCYFILVFFVHIIVDFFLFVYRAIHRFLNHGFGGASNE